MSLGLDAANAQLRIIVWGNSSSVSNVPTGFSDLKAIAAGGSHGLALRSNGVVVAWGDNSSGQTNVPIAASNVIAIAAGGNYSLALRANGTVIGWGNNVATNIPSGLTNVTAIAAGGTHALARRSDGTVVAWGNNSSGKTNVPTGLTSVAAISAGDTHSLVLKSNGTLVAWGDNNSGQTNSLPGLTNALGIAAGYHHNLAIRTNGTVAAWELNVDGEGDVPAGLSNVVAVAGGYFFSMALRSDGTVVAWGNPTITNVPLGLTNVMAIATPVSGFGEFALALTPSPVCPPGFPDNFECRSLLSGTNISFSVSNVGATQEPNEPQHFDLDAGASLWYSWTAPFSGGAIITANSSFITPCLAVYTGSNLATLTNVARNNTTFNQSRVVFNAVTGITYQIAVDGTLFNGSPGEGSNYVTLKLNLPPANDSFAGRTPIDATFFAASGSFIGATQEIGEPAHTNSSGDASFKQTLWWSWTAPTNLNASTIPVRLTADGVSFPPNIGVYTGASLSSLTNVSSLTSRTNGMTRVADFIATAGTNYQIALGGLQYDATGINASPRFGDFRLRLNIHGLVLAITNLSPTTNVDNSISFTASAQVANYGSASSYPLRIIVTTNSGISVKGQDSGTLVNSNGVVMTTNFTALAVGQSVVKRITGTIPPPAENGGQTLGVGYGAYAELQEQVDTNWITVDQALVMFGVWPGLGGFGGPGGGVIRIDPSVTGSAFNPLTNVSVLGPLTISEGSTAVYLGRARYANGFQYDFTNTTWTTTRFSVTNGVLTTGIVTSNSPMTLVAKYSNGGFIYDAPTNITILDLPPPSWSGNVGFSNKQFKATLNGVPGRKHVVEATANLAASAAWIPLATNTTATNGLWLFLDAKATNFNQRFYRARETE